MITIIASESFVQSLIDEQCRDFLNDYLREQRRIKREAWEREAYQTLRETEEQLKAFYEAGDIDAFEETYSFFSDYYKDIHYFRPHGWLDSQPWYHGRPWFEDYCKRKYPQLYS